jgi:hypothetical protein
MSPFLQFRLWLREGGPTEKALAFGIALFASTLIAYAVVPVALTGEGHSGIAAGSPEGGPLVPTGPEVAAPTGGAPLGGSSRPVVPGSPVQPGQLGPIPGAAPGTAPLRPGSATGERPATGPSSASVKLTASDRGISPSTIKVGFSILNDTTTGLGTRADVSAAINAFVYAINRQGPAAFGLPNTGPGLLGRKIEPIIKKLDPFNQADMQAKCVEFTETDKVYAVLDSAAGAIVRQCFTTQHKTPFINATAFDAKTQNAGAPYDITIGKNANRIMKDLAYGAKALGFFDPAKGFKKLGIVEQGDASMFKGPTGIRTYLKQVGVPDSAITEFVLGGDATQQTAQTQQAAIEFKRQGVTHVFPLMLFTLVQVFTSNAEAQNWRPEYFASDWLTLGLDQTAKNYPPNQWDRTRMVTELTSGELNAGRPLNGPAKACNKMLVARGVPPMDDYDGENVEVADFCDALKLLAAGMQKQNPNPTRASFAAALDTVGAIRLAKRDTSIFDRPGKYSGGDTIATIEWRRECSCWHQIASHRPAYG